jgi:hypothetical protein
MTAAQAPANAANTTTAQAANMTAAQAPANAANTTTAQSQ